jgi:tetratricopeptide (TPR) repeat protein
MKCPVCRATYRGILGTGEIDPLQERSGAKSCKRCASDLSLLIQVYDRAIAYHRAAIAQFVAGDLQQAIENNAKAIGLHAQEPSFHAFAGQLFALQGELKLAVRSWKITQTLDPKYPLPALISSLIGTL